MSLPSLAETEQADWPTLQRLCATLGLNPKGRTGVVRMRIFDHVRRRLRPEAWRPGVPQEAALLTRLGFPETAIRLWESTIQLDEPAPWIGLGRAQLGAGDLLEASKSFDRAAQMGDATALLQRAESLAAAGDSEGAVRACDSYLAARPKDLRALLLKANFLSRGGWAAEAATVLRDGFESHPDARELWWGLGAILLKGGRFEEAAEAYHGALRVDPRDVDAWVNRGAALLLAGHPREAIGAFREALEIDPRHATALNDLGVAYLREDQVKSAAVNLERAAKHMETPQILLNVAKVQEATHQKAAALDSYSRVLRLKPKDAEAAAARKRLSPRRPARKAPTRKPVRRPRKGKPAPRLRRSAPRKKRARPRPPAKPTRKRARRQGRTKRSARR